MNFDFLKPYSKLKKLYKFCNEADEFVLSRPNISVTSARKRIEFIVKMIFASITGEYALSVFEMVTNSCFINYIND